MSDPVVVSEWARAAALVNDPAAEDAALSSLVDSANTSIADAALAVVDARIGSLGVHPTNHAALDYLRERDWEDLTAASREVADALHLYPNP